MDDAAVDVEKFERQLQLEIAQRVAAEERLQSLSDQLALASKTLHDVNNQLLVIHYVGRQLQSQIPESDPNRSLITAIEQARKEAADATRRLRSNGCRSLVSQTTELNEIVRNVESLLKPILRDNLIFTLRLTPKPTFVSIEPTVAFRTVMLLVTNALLSVGEGGWVAVETFLTSPRPSNSGLLPTGPIICIQVSDTGFVRQGVDYLASTSDKDIGNSPAIVKHVQQTMAGSGVGIHLVATPDEGSRIRLEFPTHEDSMPHDVPPAPHVDFTKRSRTVLLVDDEPQIRKMLRSWLEQQGLRILEAGNGKEAIQLGLTEMNQIDLLLTDYHMPGVSGLEIAKTLQSRHPHLPVLIMSGSNILDESLTNTDLNLEILTKPFQPNELLSRVCSLLTAPPVSVI